ncbi:beta-1,3-galactosyltransferase 5-like [Physella acuta]|uniref:beta-1,3-galactosyltransferase 5-like n=1 Tax=Physella acuta TaxID=109671 RepID=UPI0027DBF318|nr:beta-1,3-galactosyltransferase 5-like [Physella acuta]
MDIEDTIGAIRHISNNTWIVVTFGALLLFSVVGNFVALFHTPRYRSCPNHNMEIFELHNRRAEVKVLDAVIQFLSTPAINEHHYAYLYNNYKACAGGFYKILFVVPSEPASFDKRNLIRRGSIAEFIKRKQNAKLLFFLGRPAAEENDIDIQLSINQEIREFNDIVQEDYEDVYKNGYIKYMSMLKWASIYCRKAEYVIRVNDDVEIDLQVMTDALNSTRSVFINYVVGLKVTNVSVVRDASQAKLTRYYLTHQEYPEDTLPPFIYHIAAGFPIRTAMRLYQAALRVPVLKLEDVFITGLCPQLVDVALVHVDVQPKLVDVRDSLELQ